MNDLFSQAKKNKSLTTDNIPQIKHDCIKAYGYEWWNTVSLKEVFEQYRLIQEDRELQKQRDEIQKTIAKALGVKFK